jgi:hypothetical protein
MCIRKTRIFLIILSFAWFASPAFCATDNAALIKRIDASLGAASKFLISQQSPDAAWRSHVYGMMKDGPSLTPQVLSSLYDVQQNDDALRQSQDRGLKYIHALYEQQTQGDQPRIFSIYSAAVASRLVMIDHDVSTCRAEQSYWLHYIHSRQLNAQHGWSATDPPFGGWGYSITIPIKPAPEDHSNPFASANISATVFALDALHFAQSPIDDQEHRDALMFVKRCQNLSDNPSQTDPKFDDGGFFFMPDDAAWNKAGVAGVDQTGRTRFHSYGAATADGLRALRDCGLPPTDPRIVAARKWLEDHFDAKSNPGTFEPDRKVLQNATFFYYAASVSSALMPDGKEFNRNRETVSWVFDLASELLSRQRPDGSWTNHFTDSKEDDPLVATPAAITALVHCQQAMEK